MNKTSLFTPQECSNNDAAFALLDTFTSNPSASFVLIAILGDALALSDKKLTEILANYYHRHKDNLGEHALRNLSSQYENQTKEK
jgi:hypothetical protein